MKHTVLVAVAHADDEVLGCGGTIARHVRQGDPVHVVIFADGTSSRGGADDAAAARRAGEAAAALRILGVTSTELLGYADQRLDREALLELTQALETHIRRLAPSLVYTHHGGDLNLDHRLVYQATLTACRPVPGASVRAIRTFETLSSTEWSAAGIGAAFVPNVFVDISAELDVKLAALAAYASELREFPHPRSPRAVEALARLRGSTVGVAAAEAFMLVRELDA